MPSLPPPLATLVDRVNAGDTDGFLALFTDDGAVNDWGRRFAGHAAIRSWSDKEFIGARGTLTITRIISATPTEVVTDTDWKSSAFSGASRMTFRFDGDKLREMVISAH